MTADYDPAADPVHGSGWNSAARWGGWSWRDRRYGEFFRTCSFCGCIHPEDLAAETANATCTVCGVTGWYAHFGAHPEDGHLFSPAGWYASWADRKYGWPHKFYVEGLHSRDPSLLHCIAAQSGSEAPAEGYMGLQWHPVAKCPRRLLKIARADGMAHSAENQEGWLGFGTRATVHAKFYTIHLADPAVSDEVKDAIQRACGLHFTFTGDGRVDWRPYPGAT